MYRSAWFIKARRYVENRAAPWFILSAEHGLVAPDDRIAPYDRTLIHVGRAARRAWALGVLEALTNLINSEDEIIFFAGARYREYLLAPLEERGISVRAPMEHLRIGSQLQWLDANARS
jgi:hypothetical protein